MEKIKWTFVFKEQGNIVHEISNGADESKITDAISQKEKWLGLKSDKLDVLVNMDCVVCCVREIVKDNEIDLQNNE